MTYIESLRLEQFRNHEDTRMNFCPGSNVIFGDNAQGKTNILEAVSYLSSARSFRARSERELIRFGCRQSAVSARVFAADRKYDMEIKISDGCRRKLMVNQISRRTVAEYSGIFHTVLFSPEDLYLVREGAATRRKFMDFFICQLRPRYARALAEYNRLYEHKTRILKDCVEKPSLLSTLEDFNLRMAQTGAVIVYFRAYFAQRLSKYAEQVHRDFSGEKETLRVEYQTVKTVTDPCAPPKEIFLQLLEHQKLHEKAELAARSCLSGPHKDDLKITIDGNCARSFASQGQARTAALSLKLAEREIFYHDSGEFPILLLDDVLSELDPNRQEFVLNRIQGGQVLITCCEDERLSRLGNGKIFTVKNGTVSEL